MKSKIQHTIIFIVSLVFGILGVLQYVSLTEKTTSFEENNPFREIRLLVESNQEMKEKIKKTHTQLEELSTKEQITKNAEEKITEANNFSGENFDSSQSITLLAEGALELQPIVELLNTLWNSGVTNIEINGIALKAGHSGIDQSGEQILIGGTPIQAPLLLKLFGNKEVLLTTLDPKTGTLTGLQSDITFTLSADD